MSETDVEVIVGGNTSFAFDLYRKLKVICFSPHTASPPRLP